MTDFAGVKKVPSMASVYLRKLQHAIIIHIASKRTSTEMGQPPTDNPFGNCATCDWTGDTPKTVMAVVSGVLKPILFPDFPSVNGLFLLNAEANCQWMTENACLEIHFHLAPVTVFTIQVDPTCEFPKREIAFEDQTGGGCKTEFVQQLAGNPNFEYTEGTASVFIGLPSAAMEWIPAYGILPASNWKYEQRGADNDLEQIYLGSRKYKTNCRILYDPAEIIEP